MRTDRLVDLGLDAVDVAGRALDVARGEDLAREAVGVARDGLRLAEGICGPDPEPDPEPACEPEPEPAPVRRMDEPRLMTPPRPTTITGRAVMTKAAAVWLDRAVRGSRPLGLTRHEATAVNRVVVGLHEFGEPVKWIQWTRPVGNDSARPRLLPEVRAHFEGMEDYNGGWRLAVRWLSGRRIPEQASVIGEHAMRESIRVLLLELVEGESPEPDPEPDESPVRQRGVRPRLVQLACVDAPEWAAGRVPRGCYARWSETLGQPANRLRALLSYERQKGARA